MILYLAGPMRGVKLFNFHTFFAAAEALQERGHVVLNPAAHDMARGFDPSLPIEDAYNQGVFNLAEAFEWDFEAIRKSDAIALLPGWEGSKGAQAEVVLAMSLGRTILTCNQDGDLTELPPMEYDVSFTTANERALIEECGHHGSSVYDPEGGQDVPYDPFDLTDEQRAVVDKAFGSMLPKLRGDS